MRVRKFVASFLFFTLLLPPVEALADREYSAFIIRVIDGDTVHARLDLGFGLFLERDIRLYGIDAPEFHGKKRPTGEPADMAKARLAELVEGRAVIVRIPEGAKEKYGRILGVIILSNGVCVNDLLVSEGLAMRYTGGRR